MLARSMDAAKYYLRLDYEKTSDIPLYGSLNYADEERAVFSNLVGGQDRDRVPDGLNLYIADYYQVYRLASELGFTFAWAGELSRGRCEWVRIISST